MSKFMAGYVSGAVAAIAAAWVMVKCTEMQWKKAWDETLDLWEDDHDFI